MHFEDLNEAILVALEKKWGFHHCHFVPRRAIALVRSKAQEHYPVLLKVNSMHLEAVEKLIERAQLTEEDFANLELIYSGTFDKTGKLHIYKSSQCGKRSGDIQIAPEHVDAFMVSVFHEEWRQTLIQGNFNFIRADLKYIPDDLPYMLYGS